VSEISAWVTSSCADLGLVVTSAGERTHDRPWSFALVYDVRETNGTDGRVWFKANGIGTRHEPGLISALVRHVPDLVPEVLAIDVDRAWSLTRDAGPTLRSAVPVTDRWPLWEDLLQRYAAAQLALTAVRPELLTTGVPERSPATLPGQAAELIAELSQEDADSGGLPEAQTERLTALLPAYGQWCRDLDRAGIPCTIQHDDLHSNNICLDLTAEPRIIDWGDASLGHPFGTMTTTLRSIAHECECDVDDPRVLRVRDAYLEPFTAYAAGPELIALADIAQRVGTVTRALSWRTGLLGTPVEVQRTYEFPVRAWLQELLPTRQTD
jgi:Phosphotransferase enzyme family